MDDEKQREAARKGGASVPAEERSFSKDRELAAEAGRKGGESSGEQHGGRNPSDQESTRGGGGNFADDREKASEAGRKGGQR
jgi:hypothetical protein